MKAIDRWSDAANPTISFELFPARTEKAAANLQKAIIKLAALEPDFVSVTFGAGGSTRDGSYELIRTLMQDYGLDVIAYFACFGLGPGQITEVLNSYRDLGVDNILLVRGDPPHGSDEFQAHPESFAHAIELVEYVRPQYDFCLGVAGYPEGHINCESVERDLAILKRKVDAGADYVIANYFYDNQYFFDLVDRCHDTGIRVPIVPGIMPVYSVKMMENLARLCGATITDELRSGLDALPPDDKSALSEFGIQFAVSQCRDLLRKGVPGLHIYTMDRSKSTIGLVTQLRAEGLLPST